MNRIEEYYGMFNELMKQVDTAALTQAAEAISEAYRQDKQIFTAGNGGSAAIAVHFAADFGKNVAPKNDPDARQPRISSLCCNTSCLTAIGNDCGYEHVFDYQLRNFLNPGDVVVLVSSSGNSPNVVLAAQFAKAQGATVITLTGFSGGKLKPLADIALHIDSNVYELIEDVHSFFTHAIVHFCKR